MSNQDPRLRAIRHVHRLRAGGKTWPEIAKHVGVSIPTARKYLEEYHERRKARTLFADIESARDVDIYAHPVHMNAWKRAGTESTT